ncbi:hypothetical protein VaNZ11_006420 [Volvox africanus]|uniref:Zinc finger PHD-type domain-containing protein n=1 Tax=Volvox africanus TaxID=51714 RepID=A0ABQ5S1X1_9CHLO|nr:hypothetical protein VaNZ11_006420 [Volvox africanus]
MAPKPTRVERQTKLHSEAVFVDWRSCSSPPHIYVSHDEFRPHLSHELNANEDIEIRIQVPGKEVGGIDRRPLYSRYTLLDECGPDGQLRARIDMSNVHGYILNTKAYKVEIVSGDELQVWSSNLQDWFVLGLVTPKCAACNRETSNSGSEMLRCENCKRFFHRLCATPLRGRFVCSQCQTHVAAAQKGMETHHQDGQPSQGLDEEQLSHEPQKPLERHRKSSQQDVPSPEQRQPVASQPPAQSPQQEQQQVSQQQRQSQQLTPGQRHARLAQDGSPKLQARPPRWKKQRKTLQPPRPSQQQQQQSQLELSVHPQQSRRSSQQQQPPLEGQRIQQEQEQQLQGCAVEEDSCSQPGVQQTVRITGQFVRKRLAQPDSVSNYTYVDEGRGAGNSAARSVGKGDGSGGPKRQRLADGSLLSAPVDDYASIGLDCARNHEMETGGNGDGVEEERASMPLQDGGPKVVHSIRDISENTAEAPRRVARRDRRTRMCTGATEGGSQAVMSCEDDTAAAEKEAPKADDEVAEEEMEPTDKLMDAAEPEQPHQDGQDASEVGGPDGELDSEDDRSISRDGSGGGGRELYELSSTQDVSDDDSEDDVVKRDAAAKDGTVAYLGAPAPHGKTAEAAATGGDREPAGDESRRAKTAMVVLPSTEAAASVEPTCSQGIADPSGSGGAAAVGGSVANPAVAVAVGREGSAADLGIGSAGALAPRADSVIGREAQAANERDGDGGSSDGEGDGGPDVVGSDPYLEALLRDFPYGGSSLPPPLSSAPTDVLRPSPAGSRLQAPPDLPASCPEYLRTVYAEIRQVLDRGAEAESVFARKERQATACWQRMVKLYSQQKAQLGRRCSAMQQQQARLTRQLEQTRIQLRRQADELQATSAAAEQSREEAARLRQQVSELQQQLQLAISGKADLEAQVAAAERNLARVRRQLASKMQVEDARRERQELEQRIDNVRQRHQQELQQQKEDFRRRSEQELEQAEEAARRQQELEGQLEEARRQQQQQLHEARQEVAALRSQLAAAQGARGAGSAGEGQGGGPVSGRVHDGLGYAVAAGHGHGLRADASEAGETDRTYVEQLEATAARLRVDLMRQMAERVEERRSLEAEVERWRQLARRNPARTSVDYSTHIAYQQPQSLRRAMLASGLADIDGPLVARGPGTAAAAAAAGSLGFPSCPGVDGPSGSGAGAGLPYQHHSQTQGTSSRPYQNGQGNLNLHIAAAPPPELSAAARRSTASGGHFSQPQQEQR